MEHRFRRHDRAQQFLLPPDVRDWVPAGHASLFVSDLVAELDLSAFVAANRSTRGRGRPAYHPEVMVGIAMYASMTATMSSRRIEERLWTDVGFRVVAANQQPDHVTICRFLTRHHEALKDLFTQVVALAVEAGLVDLSVVAVDGTKMSANASMASNVTLEKLRERYQGWADDVAENDTVEDEAEESGEVVEPVAEMADRDRRREWIRKNLWERRGDPGDRKMNVVDPDSRIMSLPGGVFRQGYNAQAVAVAGGIVIAADVTSHVGDHLVLEDMCDAVTSTAVEVGGVAPAVLIADAGYWDTETIDNINGDPDRVDVLVATGRKTPKEPPAPLEEPDLGGYRQALSDYEAALDTQYRQRVAVIARVITNELVLREAADELGLSVPRVYELKRAWINHGGPHGLRPTKLHDVAKPKPPPSPTPTVRAKHAMDTRLASPAGKSIYRQRKAIIEPVFGDIKHNRRTRSFTRRGINKVRTEWLWILMGHNLGILHQRGT